MVLDTMPLTPTGKLDRVALRPMLLEWMAAQSSSNGNANGGNTIGGAEPDDPLECAVAAAWCNAIGVPKVGRRSDFVRLGGDSIKALQVSRSLSFSLVHAHAVPPSRGETREGTAEAADYGVLRGVFAPSVLLRLPLLYRYADFLRSIGVRVPVDGEDPVEAAAEERKRAAAAATAVASSVGRPSLKFNIIAVSYTHLRAHET